MNISDGVNLLRELKAENAAEETKISFLTSKGFSIQECKEIIEKSMLGCNEFLPTSVYLKSPFLSKETIQNLFIVAITALISSVYALFNLKDFVLKFYNPLLLEYANAARKRLIAVNEYCQVVINNIEAFKNILDCKQYEENILLSFQKVVYLEQKKLAKLVALMNEKKELKISLEALSNSTSTAAANLRTELYFPKHQKGVSDIRSDIRSLKGILLSRRNFPFSNK